MNKILKLTEFIGKNLAWVNEVVNGSYQGEWCCYGLTKLVEKYIDTNAVISTSCTSLMNMLVNRGISYIDCNHELITLGNINNIKVGDYCFFDWDASGDADHIGIVVEVTNTTVTTLECNFGSDGWKNNKIGTRKMAISFINKYVHMFVHMYNDTTIDKLIRLEKEIAVSTCSRATGYLCDIRILQTILRNLNLYDDDIDGIFGDNTYNAVINFQRNCKIEVDGIVGIETWSFLIDEI